MTHPWNNQRVARTLGGSPPFDAYPPLARRLAAGGQIRTFEPGDDLICQGDEGEELHLILSGSVEVRVNDQVVAVRAAVSHVGEMSVLNPAARRSATVTARESVVSLVLSAEDVESIGEEFPALYRHLARELARRLERRSHPSVTTSATRLGWRTLRRLADDAEVASLYDRAGRAGFVRAAMPQALSGGSAVEDLRVLARRAEPGPLNRWLRHADRIATPGLRPLLESAIREVALSGGAPPARLERARRSGEMLPVTFATMLAESARAVAHLTVQSFRDGRAGGSSCGTGALLSPSLLVTAWHVVGAFGDPCDAPRESDLNLQLSSLEVRFDYDGSVIPGTPDHRGVSIEASDETLDIAILRLASPTDRRPLRCARHDIRVAPSAPTHANVIQHPEGREKRMVVRNNHLHDRQGDVLRYHSDTLPGSSGAPVLDDLGQVIAVHTSSPDLEEPVEYQGEAAGWLNCGTAIDAILAWLRREHQALASEILQD